MAQEQPVAGGIIVHSRTELYKIGAGPTAQTFYYVDGTYTGALDGTAAESFVVADHGDDPRTLYGFGTFIGRVNGRSGTLAWKFIGHGGDGMIEILSGTGELAGLTGTVPYGPKPGSANEFTYSGMVTG